MSKYYDGSKMPTEKTKSTKKSVAKKIISGAGSVLGLALTVVTGASAYNKFNKKA